MKKMWFHFVHEITTKTLKNEINCSNNLVSLTTFPCTTVNCIQMFCIISQRKNELLRKPSQLTTSTSCWSTSTAARCGTSTTRSTSATRSWTWNYLFNLNLNYIVFHAFKIPNSQNVFENIFVPLLLLRDREPLRDRDFDRDTEREFDRDPDLEPEREREREREPATIKW